MTVHDLTYPFARIDTEPQILAVGYFDGVHKGHQQVLIKTKELANKHNATPGILTFHPHPSEVLGKNPIRRYITPLEEKITQFHYYGFDTVYVIRFDTTFSQVLKEEFVEGLISSLSIKGIVTGSNFTFGKGAAGKPQHLQQLSQGRFKVETVDLLQEDGKTISSTRIRHALADGRIEEVTAILGRGYCIKGKVVPGDQRGREMGFPTANLSLIQPFMVPRYGVYVVGVEMKDGRYVRGIMNIGVRPTINQSHPVERLEVHLFDWDEAIYGEIITIQFLMYLREEKKFSSIELLIHQINEDIKNAKVWIEQVATV